MQVGWVLWLALAALFSWPAFERHLQIFALISPLYYRAILVLLPLGAGAGWLYTVVRRLGLWRREPILLACVPLVIGALYAPLATVVLAGIGIVATGLGKAVLRWLEIEAEIGMVMLTGFALLSPALFALGVAHLFYVSAFAGLLTLAVVVARKSFAAVRDDVAHAMAAWQRDEELKESQVGVAVFALLILTAMAALAWVTPTTSGDPVRIHLSLVRVFLASHSLDVPQVIPYGHFPQGFEVLAAMAYSMGGQFAAQGMELIFFALLLRLTYLVARACGATRGWSVVGIALAMAVPFVHWDGSAFKNDSAMAAYEVGALLCFLRWRENGRFRWIVVGTLLIAASFGVKHVALFGAVPLFCLYAYAVWQQPSRVRAGASVAAVFLCFGLLWHVRTYVATGNPVYPESLRTSIRPARSKQSLGGRLLRYVTVPYEIHADGKKYFESGSPNPAGIVLLLLAPLWLARRNGRMESAVWIFAGLYYLYWAGVWLVLRYAVALFVVLAALGAMRLHRQPRWAALAAIGLAVAFSVPAIVIMELTPAQIPYLLKRIDKDEYLRRTLPSYRAAEYVNGHANSEDGVASVGNWAAGYSLDPAKFDHVYRTDGQYDAADVATVLKGEPKYLILPQRGNLGELERAAETGQPLTRVYADEAFVVYSLARPAMSPATQVAK